MVGLTFAPCCHVMTCREFFPKHSNVLRDLRHLLVPAELGSHAAALAEKVSALLSNHRIIGTASGSDKGIVELYALVRSTIFQSAVAVLFGNGLAE